MNVDIGTKRNVVFTENNVWLDTTPFKVANLKDCSHEDLRTIIKIITNEKDSNESLNTMPETYQSDADREDDSSGNHSDGYGSFNESVRNHMCKR